MQQSQRAPVGTAETVPTSVDRALRGVFAFVFFAVTIASVALSVARSGRPSPELTTAMCAALVAWQMPVLSRSCARTTSGIFTRVLEWAGITFAAISIVAATVSAFTGDGGGYEQFATLSRIANGALLGTLCFLIALLVLKYRSQDTNK